MVSALWWCKRPHTSKECRCSWGGELNLLQQARVKICVYDKKKGALILNCTVAKKGYFKLSRIWFSPFPQPGPCWENTIYKCRRNLIWNICAFSSCKPIFPLFPCSTIFSALLILISVSTGSSRDTRANFNDLGILLKAVLGAQCSLILLGEKACSLPPNKCW